MNQNDATGRGLTLYLGGYVEAWWLGLALATVAGAAAVRWARAVSRVACGRWTGLAQMERAERVAVMLMGAWIGALVAVVLNVPTR